MEFNKGYKQYGHGSMPNSLIMKKTNYKQGGFMDFNKLGDNIANTVTDLRDNMDKYFKTNTLFKMNNEQLNEQDKQDNTLNNKIEQQLPMANQQKTTTFNLNNSVGGKKYKNKKTQRKNNKHKHNKLQNNKHKNNKTTKRKKIHK
jgi:hypothetical protein